MLSTSSAGSEIRRALHYMLLINARVIYAVNYYVSQYEQNFVLCEIFVILKAPVFKGEFKGDFSWVVIKNSNFYQLNT